MNDGYLVGLEYETDLPAPSSPSCFAVLTKIHLLNSQVFKIKKSAMDQTKICEALCKDFISE